MSLGDIFTKTWEWDITVVAGCFSLLVGFMVWHDFRPRPRWVWYFAGVLFLLLALVSPLHTLGDTYLFSAHMVQHLLLMLIVPPFLLMGLSPKRLRRLLQRPWVYHTERILALPLIALLLGLGTMWLWHWPALYEATLANHTIHVLEHLSFLVTSTIFWWPIITPVAEKRLPALPALVYLFTAGFSGLILGILLTFAPPLYQGYQSPPDMLGLLPTIREQWRISLKTDQQMGGLIMWVASGPIYLGAILWVVAGWFGSQEDAARLEASFEVREAEIKAETMKPEQSRITERAVTVREEIV